jgi:hypothetical protein
MEQLLGPILPDDGTLQPLWLSAQVDNDPVHRSKASDTFLTENAIARVPCPGNTPDLASSDFWFIVHMKGALAGQQFTGPADRPDGIQAFLDESQMSELECVFHRRFERAR